MAVRDPILKLLHSAADLAEYHSQAVPDHAGGPWHYAHEWLRDLLEEVIDDRRGVL